MPLKWDCLEAVAGVAAGAASCFAATNPVAGLAVVPAVAGAKLFGLFGAAREKHGIESETELNRIRAAVLAAWSAHDPHEQFDVESADTALSRLLPAAMPDAMALGRLVATSDYPGEVVALVLAQLASRDSRFGRDGTERRFAGIVIRAALEAALANPDFTRNLTVPMLIGLGEGLAEANAKLDRLVASAEAGFDPVEIAELQRFQRAVLQLAQLADERANTPEAALAELRAMLRTVLDQRAAARHGSNLGDWLDGMIRRVTEANAAGRFAAAAELIDRTWQDQQRQRAERAEAERAADLRLCDLAIGQQRLLPDGAAAAADWLRRKVEREAGTTPAPANALAAAFDEWQERGRDFGVAFDLEVAIALAAAEVARLTSAGQGGGWEYGRWNNLLGIALTNLGAWQDDGAALDRAITAYEAALTVHTSEALPLDWAATQNNLGAALQTLGERQDDGAALAKAITAYEAALTVRTREALPLDWAMTQNNLGAALRALGERQDDGAALARAITAFEAALTVRTRDALPLQWAMTQENLAYARMALARLQRDRASAEAAVAALQAALTVFSHPSLAYNRAKAERGLALAEALVADLS